jgi:glutamate 5-kinase
MRRALIKRVKRIVIKFGSYVLTTRAWNLDRKVFLDLARSTALQRKSNIDVIVVSSGAIAAGMGKLGLKERPKSIPLEQAAAAIGQISLMAVYEKLFARWDIQIAQVLLTHSDLKDRKRFLNARHTLNTLLEYKVIPIINENDSTVVEEIKVGDNDHLSALVTNLVQADLLIIMTDIDGLYDRDPKKFKDAGLISVVENIDAGIQKLALGTKSPISRGGMTTKIKAAKTAILEKGKSILPSGIIDVQGEFDSGETVRCCDKSGFEFARGLANYGSSDILKVRGLKTSAIEVTLGYLKFHEIIHRDNLVILQGS